MKSKIISKTLVVSVILSMVAGVYWQVKAQDEVVNYLQNRFEQKNIPVTEVTVLERFPLSIQVVIQAKNPWITAEDVRTMRLVDREVLIFAPQQGYVIDGYTRVLEGSDGKQLDLTIQKPDIEKISRVNFSRAILPDFVVQRLVSESINKYLNEYNLENLTLDVDISSDEGLQTLSLYAKVDSMEQANNAAFFLWSFPHFSIIDDINAKGARIVFYRAKIADEYDETLFNYSLDTEMGSGGWTIDNRLRNPSGGSSPPPAP
jgi:hypothetical protein